jgi:serine/threonine protein kinase
MVTVGSVVADRYELNALIDAGGLGSVWPAVDRRSDEVVAVKTRDCSSGTDEMFGRRYVAEMQYLAAISHPGVVPVLGHGYDEPIVWAAMPLLTGESVRARLARVGPVTPTVAMAWLVQVATTIHVVHHHGVAHRGLRPSRLFLLTDERIVLTDFGGLSTQTAANVSAAPHLAHAAYLAPEQAIGEPATELSDVYQLGLIAYECLAGRPPFVAEHPFEVAFMHFRQEPPPLPDEVPATVRTIVQRCLAKSPAQRWPSAAALAQAAAQAT